MNPVLVELMSLDRVGLTERWQQTFGHPAPFKMHQELLRQTLGWHLQARAQGGLGHADRRRLKKGMIASSLSVGSRLVRVWQGETHQVTVVESGFLYQGKTWRSLSMIARTITGTSWSGPVFFGIKAR